MSNSLITPSLIAKEAVRLWKNENAFLRNVDTQYDDSFARTGAKAGYQIRIRLPVDYVVRKGATASVQDTSEQVTSITVATQAGVDMQFSTADLTMVIDDFSERYIAPAVNNIAGQIASDLMSTVETGAIGGAATQGGVCSLSANVDGSNNLLAPNQYTVLDARARLTSASTPSSDYKLVMNPYSDAKLVGTLSNLYNPMSDISKQYRSGTMGRALGFDIFEDQTVLTHTNGSCTSASVAGANQSGTTLLVSAITGTFNVGDIITIANVYGVNRITKASTGKLQQFVITAAAASGATSLSIYPAITPPQAGSTVQYQTVTASPANAAAVTPVLNPGITYRKNIAYSPEAITLAMVDMDIPRGLPKDAVARENQDGVAIRVLFWYNGSTDTQLARTDVLYGGTITRPEWCVIVADVT